MGNLSSAYANDFFDQYLDCIGKLVQPIYAISTVDKVLEMIPAHLESSQVQLFKTRWPFFSAVQHHETYRSTNRFPPSNIFKISFQTLYNSLKVWLDANTEPMISITTGIKVGFEQKYVLCLNTALITNAWRSFQLLQYGIEIESMTFAKMKQTIKCNSTRLKDFLFHLALALIRSDNERMYYMDKVTIPAIVWRYYH
jgi:hypothetical protein